MDKDKTPRVVDLMAALEKSLADVKKDRALQKELPDGKVHSEGESPLLIE